MPCYYWKGIDLKGSIHTGKKFYRSENHLEQDLLMRNIGLMECCSENNTFRQRVPFKIKDSFIEHLYTLLKSQIRLHQSLELSSHSISHKYFKEVIVDISSFVLGGRPLYEALALYPKIFDHLIINIIAAGEKSSNLINALKQLVDHNHKIKECKTKIKSALFMPVLTFSFFAIVMGSFFIFIIPRFEGFFQSFKTPLPPITQYVLSLSLFIRLHSLPYLIISMVSYCILFNISKLSIFENIRDRALFSIPVIKNVSLMLYRLRFLQILSLSLSSGMHLLGCLNLAYTTMKSKHIKKIIKQLINNIENGINLSKAIEQSYLADLETLALIKIGESSGNLDPMVERALHLYQQKFYQKIDYMSSLIHPIVLLILGGLIALSIFAVYVPIFTLTAFIN